MRWGSIWTTGIVAVIGTLAHAGDSAPPSYVSAAVADSHRPADQVTLDLRRKPADLIAFSEMKPGDHVADFMSGNAYFTRMFSQVVGPRGHVYAILPTEQLAHCSPAEVAGTYAIERDAHYENVSVLRTSATRFNTPKRLDIVWLSQDYHDLHDQFMQPVNIHRFNRSVYRALKRGGIYLIIDHVATKGSGLRDTETLHRIDPAVIQSEVTQAGFILEKTSDVLRNPLDTHALPVFDPAIRYRSDQVVYRFRKP
jgi:predicted methyltransferase